MNVRPRYAACFDVGLDQLVPHDMWICAIPAAEHAKVHDVLDASFSGGIDEGLALGQHRHRVAGKQEDTVHGVKRGSKSGRTVEIEKNCVPALLLKTRRPVPAGARLLEHELRLASVSSAQE